MDTSLNMDIFSSLNDMRLEGKLCDACLVVDVERFPVHRLVLAAYSPYFRALFTNGMIESRETDVIVKEIPAPLLSIVIDHAYTGQLMVNWENVQQLLPLADQLHITDIIVQCTNFLVKQLQSDNCIGIRDFAEQFLCKNLKDEAEAFLHGNYEEVSNGSEFLHLTATDLASILSRDELNVSKEEAAFKSVVRWVSYDIDTRKQYLPNLLKKIRLGLIHHKYFSNTLACHPLLKSNADCMQTLDIASWTVKVDMLEKDDHSYINGPVTNTYARPRIPHGVIFAIGGWSGGSPTTSFETYDPRADRWFMHPFRVDVDPRAYHGLVAYNNLIYILGGYDGTIYFNNVRCFDPIRKKWHEKAPMYFQRCYVSVAVLNGHIYACGGCNGRVRLNSVERYHAPTNQWTLVSPLNQRRSDSGTDSANGKLYICGGFNGEECLNSAEVYDPESNQWTLITPMMVHRSGLSVSCYRGNIYAIGGFNGIIREESGEYYDTLTKSWVAIKDMTTRRSNFAMLVLDDKLYVIGGFNGHMTIPHVEWYSEDSEEWTEASDMNVNRSALDACVIKGLSNVTDYTYHGNIHNTQEGISLKLA